MRARWTKSTTTPTIDLEIEGLSGKELNPPTTPHEYRTSETERYQSLDQIMMMMVREIYEIRQADTTIHDMSEKLLLLDNDMCVMTTSEAYRLAYPRRHTKMAARRRVKRGKLRETRREIELPLEFKEHIERGTSGMIGSIGSGTRSVFIRPHSLVDQPRPTASRVNDLMRERNARGIVRQLLGRDRPCTMMMSIASEHIGSRRRRGFRMSGSLGGRRRNAGEVIVREVLGRRMIDGVDRLEVKG